MKPPLGGEFAYVEDHWFRLFEGPQKNKYVTGVTSRWKSLGNTAPTPMFTFTSRI